MSTEPSLVPPSPPFFSPPFLFFFCSTPFLLPFMFGCPNQTTESTCTGTGFETSTLLFSYCCQGYRTLPGRSISFLNVFSPTVVLFTVSCWRLHAPLTDFFPRKVLYPFLCSFVFIYYSLNTTSLRWPLAVISESERPHTPVVKIPVKYAHLETTASLWKEPSPYLSKSTQ